MKGRPFVDAGQRTEPSRSEPTRPKRTFSWARWVAAVVVLGASGYGVWRWQSAVPEVVLAEATRAELWSSFTAEGVVRGTEYTLAPEMGGRVAAVLVREGQTVQKGDVLLRLGSDLQVAGVDEAEAAYRSSLTAVEQARQEAALVGERHAASLDAARARLRQAELQHEQVLSGTRPELVQQATQQVAKARTALQDAQQNHQRAQLLYDGGAIARAALDKADAALRAAQADYNVAQSALEQLQRGPTPEEIAVSRSAVDAATAEQRVVESGAKQIEVARKALESARERSAQAFAALQQARTLERKQQILAPASGEVTRLEVEEGSVVVPGSPVITIATRDDLRIEAEIGTEDAAKVRAGMEVEVTVAGYPGRRFRASVGGVMSAGELKPDAAIRTRIVRARVELLESPELFFPGMEVDVEGRSSEGETLTVPTDAMRFTGEAPSVYGVVGGRIVEIPVVIGSQNPDRTEILSGLQAGDRVVVDGKDAVEPGTRVRVRRA